MHVPPGGWGTKSRMEAILSKLVKGQKYQETFLEVIKADFSRLVQNVESYAAVIRQLEHQCRQMFTTLN